MSDDDILEISVLLFSLAWVAALTIAQYEWIGIFCIYGMCLASCFAFPAFWVATKEKKGW